MWNIIEFFKNWNFLSIQMRPLGLCVGNLSRLCGVRIFWGFLQFVALGMNFDHGVLETDFFSSSSRSCLVLVPLTLMEMGDVSSLNYNCMLWQILSNHNGESYLDCRSVGWKWSWPFRPESNWLLMGTRWILKTLGFPFESGGKQTPFGVPWPGFPLVWFFAACLVAVSTEQMVCPGKYSYNTLFLEWVNWWTWKSEECFTDQV